MAGIVENGPSGSHVRLLIQRWLPGPRRVERGSGRSRRAAIVRGAWWGRLLLDWTRFGLGNHLWIDSLTWDPELSLIHISEPTRQAEISYAVFCLKKKK